MKDGAFKSQGRSRIQCQPQVSTLGTGWDGGWDFISGSCVGRHKVLWGPGSRHMAVMTESGQIKKGPASQGTLRLKETDFKDSGEPEGTDERTNLHSFLCLQCRKPRFDSWVGKILWRRELLPTPVFWPEEFHEQRNLAGYSPWGHKVRDD